MLIHQSDRQANRDVRPNRISQRVIASRLQRRPDVGVRHPARLPPVQSHRKGIRRIMLAASGANPIGEPDEARLVDRVRHRHRRMPDNPVFRRRHARRPQAASRRTGERISSAPDSPTAPPSLWAERRTKTNKSFLVLFFKKRTKLKSYLKNENFYSLGAERLRTGRLMAGNSKHKSPACLTERRRHTMGGVDVVLTPPAVGL